MQCFDNRTGKIAALDEWTGILDALLDAIFTYRYHRMGLFWSHRLAFYKFGNGSPTSDEFVQNLSSVHLQAVYFWRHTTNGIR